MKNLFIAMSLAPETATSTAPFATTPLTSDKLAELQAKYDAAWEVMIAIKDSRSKEAKDAKLAVWKIDGEMKAEELNIQKLANDAKIAEQRNLRLQLNQNQLDAFRELIRLQSTKGAKPEDVQAAQTAFDTAKELVDRELLAKYAASKPATKNADTAADTGETTSANKAAIIEMHLAGKTEKEIQDSGYARSTVWHTINKYKKANQA